MRLLLLFLALPLLAQDELAGSVKRILDVYAIVQQNASDPVDSAHAFYDGIIPGMLRRLDPHSVFLDPAQFEQLRQMQKSESKGFGSVVSVLPGRVIVLQTLPGGPSQRAGMSAGDEILAVNNIALAQLEPEQLIALLSEARQKPALVHVRRPGNARLMQFTLIPEALQSPPVDRAFLLEPGYGYIRVASFDENTSKDLKAAIDKLMPLQGLVLDLRNNPGGVVATALDSASLFLKPGQVILTAKGRKIESVEKVPDTASPYAFRLAVLINDKTASAAEILAGALQDHDRATILGEASYGKGLVQNVIPLSQSTGIALTMAYYYTPSGRFLQKPLQNSALTGATADAHKEFKTDAGRTVHASGGIEPDQPMAPQPRKPLESVLDASGAYATFATLYLREKPFTGTKVEITPDLLDRFRVFLSQNRIQPRLSDWLASSDWIQFRLAQEITNQALGVEKGDEVEAHREPYIQAGLAAIRR